MSGLDEKGLEAARAAFYGPKGSVVAAIRAYLASATPADVGEEPVAFLHPNGAIWRADNCPDYIKEKDRLAEGWTPLYSATALERVVRERDEAIAENRKMTRVNHCYAAENHLLGERATVAEAKLAEARKLVERFSNGGVDVSGTAIIVGYPEAKALWTDARRFLEETK